MKPVTRNYIKDEEPFNKNDSNTMNIIVRFFGSIREALGTTRDRIDIQEDAALQDLIETLIQKYGSPFEEFVQRMHPVLLVNGKSILIIDGLKTKLSEGSEVAIIPPYTGGSGDVYTQDTNRYPRARNRFG